MEGTTALVGSEADDEVQIVHIDGDQVLAGTEASMVAGREEVGDDKVWPLDGALAPAFEREGKLGLVGDIELRARQRAVGAAYVS